MSPAALPLPIQATPLSQQVKPSSFDRERAPPPPKRPFAELLQQSRAEAPVAPVTPGPPTTSAPSDDDTAPEDSADIPAKSLPLRPRLRAAGGMTTCSAPTEAESAATVATAATDEHDDDRSDGRGPAPAHPAMAPWRAVAAAAVEPGRVAAPAAGASTIADATDATDAGLVDAASARPSTGGIDARARGGRDDAAGSTADIAAATKDAASAVAAPLASTELAEPSPDAAAPGLHAGSGGVGAAAALAAATPNAASPADAAKAAAAPFIVATAVDSPDFAAAFGLQVSLLAKDGVQQAELHLNPADLGPVSIHIALAGSEARIDFGADLAATRHAIEQGLPELASALRDAGFTLAGGGVSQHAGERQGSDDSSAGHRPRHRGRAPMATIDAARLSRAAQAAGGGGVDLYA